MNARRHVLPFALGAALIAGAFASACGSDDIEGPGDGGLTEADSGADAPMSAPFGLDSRIPNKTCVAPARPPAGGAVAFSEPFLDTPLVASTMLAQPPGDKTRVFLSQITGQIVAFPMAAPPTSNPPVVLAPPRAVGMGGEAGLFGFAFHPKFATNGLVFFSYTANKPSSPSGLESVVARMKSNDNGNTFGDYVELIKFDQPDVNHNGGGIAFGADGFLYLGFGDGGGADDTFGNGQTVNGFFSKILRIDIDSPPAPGLAYAIPEGNPFKSGGGEVAAYAMGFRNPYKVWIDKPTNDLWVGDVGQNAWEEVNRLTAPGGNFGWPCREGAHDHLRGVCPGGTAGFVDPLFEYPQGAGGSSITGGVVYRGAAIPSLVGAYVYGDYMTGQLWALDTDPGTGLPRNTQLNPSGPFGSWIAFSADDDGEIYAHDAAAKVYRLGPAGPVTPSTFPDRLSKTGCFEASDPKKPAASLVPFGVNSELWSDGADKERFISLPDGATIAIGADGDWDLPNGSIAFKTFSLGGKPVETRMLVRHSDGAWAGYSYEWNAEGTDALLLPAGKTTPAWIFPSRGECIACHTKAAGGTLGLETAQLNRDFVYRSTNRVSNELATLDHIGMFATPLSGPPSTLPALPPPLGTTPVEGRARSYLHANCAMCHRPGIGGAAKLDLRFATGLSATGTCDVAPSAGTLGIAGAKLVAPGDATKSLLLQRMRATARTRMPPLATRTVDTAASGVVEQWIGGLAGCPP